MSAPRNVILQGDALTRLRELPDDSVDQICTSPPYYGLRDYGTPPVIFGGDLECKHHWYEVVKKSGNGSVNAEMKGETLSSTSATRKPTRSNFCSKCGAWKGQLGLEPTFELFIEHLVEIFAECYRVLKKSGTCLINMGDSYSEGGRGKNGDRKRQISERQMDAQALGRKKTPGLPAKSILGQPWKLAFALQDWGWILRQDIIWHKTQAMPESVRDRCTKAHEYIFLLVKSQKYFWDAKAIAEPVSPNTHDRMKQNVEAQQGSTRANGGTRPDRPMKAGGVNPKAVPTGWDTNPGRHGSIHREGRTIGEKLSKADESEVRGATSHRFGRGAGWRNKQNESFAAAVRGNVVEMRNARSVWSIGSKGYPGAHFATFPPEIPRRCILAGCPKGGIVLDPFGGSGTTGAEAAYHGRDYIMIELNPDYIQLMEQRLGLFQPNGESCL